MADWKMTTTPLLTKREMIAAMALQGLLSHGKFGDGVSQASVGIAVSYADALIKWLDLPTPEK